MDTRAEKIEPVITPESTRPTVFISPFCLASIYDESTAIKANINAEI